MESTGGHTRDAEMVMAAMPDLSDWMLLKLANEKGKFALGIPTPPSVHEAFERGIDGEWFTLVDLTPLTQSGSDGVFKIYRLTKTGWRHHDRLKKKYGDILRSNDGTEAQGSEASETGEPDQD